ncbi:MAG: tandem-95 repeat protein [Magnetococcales bacterium]|nr:tandem-95 repeat protein [Magnetococcales bacterium]
MFKLLQNKWLVAILIILGITVAGAFLLMVPQTAMERKGIALDRDKLPARQKQADTGKKEPPVQVEAAKREPVGGVTQLKGLAFAEFEKVKRVLEEGSPVFQGDRIVTGSKARLILKMKDDAVIALGEDSEFLVQHYTFKVRPDNTVGEEDGNKGQVELTRGLAKFTSGRLGQMKNKPFHLVTPVATMGVRGTQGFIRLNGSGADMAIEVVSLKDEVLVWMEEPAKKLSSSSGEIHFLTALIGEAFAADLGREPATVKTNQMLSGSPTSPPVITDAPKEKLSDAHTSTAVKKLPEGARKDLAQKAAQSLVDKGAAANVEEAAKLLEQTPQALEQLVEEAEEHLMEETRADVEKQLEKDEKLKEIDADLKKAEEGGDTAKLTELNEKKQALLADSHPIDTVIDGVDQKKSADGAIEKVIPKVESFAEEVTKAVAEGKNLQEALEGKAQNYREDVKSKAKALGIEDYEGAKRTGEKIREEVKDQIPGQPAPGEKTLSPLGTQPLPGETRPSSAATDVEGTVSGTSEGASTDAAAKDAGGTAAEGTKDAAKGSTTATDAKAGSAVRDPNSVFADTARTAATPTTTTTGTTSSTTSDSNKTTFSPTPISFNKPPVMAAQTFSVDENKPLNTIVGTLAATDPNTGNVLSFTLTPTDVFTVDAATGVITTVAPLDYEKTASYTLTATVTDNVPDNTKDKKITTITAAITINVKNINETPTIVAPGTLLVDEDGTLKVSGITVADPDTLVAVTTGVEPGDLSVKLEVVHGLITLTDTSGVTIVASGANNLTMKGKLPSLNNALGKLTYTPKKDYNGSDVLYVDVDDLGTQGSGTAKSTSTQIAITVQPINDEPKFNNADLKFTVDENMPVGTQVGNNIFASDVELDTITYSITKGNLGNAFAIEPDTGKITVAAKIDFEVNPIYTLEIVAKDAGLASQQTGAIPAKVVIEVNNVNEPPRFKDLPNAIGALEDTIKALSEIQIDDPDLTASSTETLKLTLSVEHGTLSTRSDHSLAEKTLTLTNTLANLRKELERLNYRGENNYAGVDTLTLKLDDQGNIGSGTTIPATGTVAISIVGVNDVPTITPITDVIIDEDKSKSFSFQVADLDTPASDLLVSVASSNTDLFPTANLVLSGTSTDRTLTATPALNRFGDAVITLTVSDKNDATQTKTSSFKVTVRAVADKPVITAATTSEDVQTTSGLVLARAGVDGDEVTHFQIKNIVNGAVYKKDGVTIVNEGEFITVAEGTAGLKFTPGTNLYTVSGSVVFGFDVFGATAAADTNVGPEKATATIAVTSVNDAPVITKPANATVLEDTALVITGLSVADVDAGTASLQVVLSALDGTVTLAKTDGISIESGTNDSAAITFSGPVTAINGALSGMSYRGDTSFSGSDTLTLKVNDQGNTGAVTTPLTDEKTVTITVTAVNDAPVITRGITTSQTYTEGDAVGNNTAMVIDEAIVIEDVDDADLSGATLTIATGKDGTKDQLDVTATETIAKSWNATTGVLTLTGSATVADYQALLRQVTFTSTSDDPKAGTRTVTIKVNDGDLDSALASYSIVVVAVNDAPSMTAGSTLNYTENDAATVVESSLTVTDLDNASLTGASATISSGYQNDTSDSDTLAFADSGGITGSWDATTGVLTLTGSATKEAYAAALKTVTFVHTGDNPTTDNRTISFVVSDGSASSTAVTSTVAMTAVNDVPVVTATASISVNEGIDAVQNTAMVIDGSITVKDAESDTITAATITIGTNYVNDEDVLIFPATLGNIQADTTNGSDSGYSGWNATSGTLKLTGSGTVAEYQAALRTIKYHNLDSDIPTASTRGISFQVTDTGQSLAATAQVTMVPQNDSPTLVQGSALLPSYTEDSPTSKHAELIDNGIVLADVDDTNIEGATVTISATYDSGKDLLAFDSAFTSSTITGTFNATTGVFTLAGSDTVANYQTALRAVTYANSSDHPTAGSRTITFAISDGSLSSNSTSVTFDATAVNDAPIVVSGGTRAYTENDAATPIDTAITVSDHEGDGLTGATVKITGNYDSDEDVLAFATIGSISGSWNAIDGTLTLSGSGTTSEYQAALRTVTYINYSGSATNDNPTAGNRTVSFAVTETTPTVNGTSALTSTAATATVTVVAVNDPPVLTAPTSTDPFTEDSTSFVLIDKNNQFIIIDAESNQIQGATIAISGIPTTTGDGPADELQFTTQNGITGTWNGGTKTLTLSGTASLGDYQTALRSVTYYNNSQDPGQGIRTLTWTVTDAGGGSATSISKTSSLTVNAVNGVPQLSGGSASPLIFTENAAATVIDTGVTVTDEENNKIYGATITISTNFHATDVGGNTEDTLSYTGNGTNINAGVWNSTTGVLTLSTTTGQTATLADYMAAFDNVKYVNSSNAPHAGVDNKRTVTWSVTDSEGATSSVGTTSQIQITAVNDAPTDIQISNNGLYAASPVGTVIGSLTVTDPDLSTDTYTFSLTSGTTEFSLANGKDTSIYTSGNLTVNLATLSTTGGNGSGVYTVSVQVTDSGGLTLSTPKTLNITVTSAPFDSGNMTPVGDATAVATIVSTAKTLFNTVVTNLVGTTPTSVSLTNDNLRTMILAKLNQQLTGSTSGLEHIGQIIDRMGVSVTSDPKIEVTMRIKALSTIHSRLPASVQTSFWGLVDTITPYGGSYTFDMKLTVVPVVSGTTITYNNSSSKLEILHLKMLPDVLSPTVPYSIALDTLVSSYNSVLTNLKTDGTLAFFLGGGVPRHIVEAAVGSVTGDTEYNAMKAQGVWTTATGNSTSAPNSSSGVRLDYFLPGNISGITFNTGNITLSP